ncbi:multidrug effflux MFS transporter [Naumannella halotolerans]|uniref:DHA1 family bicyclomycin/chloramphenicol resistance-like MFS transporter n=1 Tax=Naumannella halotolerans TaxID=993414 RepID=A0A4R7J5P1_9ACTN|nr:multidrug effflux MFS transporter [Naumannella halotolerans]TDT32534.1 DHA1 family bicyclomycin/chloramphenicol resistance-like MFS transporter [Naumannella halotolerans]
MSTPDTATATKESTTLGARWLIPLALLTALAPFGTDLYLAAFPTMVDDLSTTESGIQLSLTSFLIGAGVGQLIFGPISDRIGRMRPLVIGLVIAVAAGVAVALAPTITVLVIARLVQGICSAAGMVIGRAMISDLAVGDAAARALSLLMLVGGVAPVIAPLLGSLLVEPLGWRGLMWIVAALCLVALIGTTQLRETLPAERRGGAATPFHPSMLWSRSYVGNTLGFAFGFATMMAYISASSFLYQDLMGLSTWQYGLAFGINALGLMLSSGISARLADSVGPRRLARIGLSVNATAIVAITAIALSGLDPLWLVVPIFFAVAPLGLVFGNVTALALSTVREASGTGSALLGALQFGLAGLVAPLVSLGGEGTALPMALTMLVATVIANLAFTLGNRRPAGVDRSEPAEKDPSSTR